jgi:FkbM family methyltransferase
MGSSLRKLRPAKVRNAVRRRLFEARTPRMAYTNVPLVSLGSPYGGWVIPEGIIEPGWVCYCVGAGGDISFDLDLITRYGTIVRCIDPVGDYVRRALEDAAGEPRFAAIEAAVTSSDGPVRMQVTHDPGSESVSPSGLYESGRHIEMRGLTLRSLMEHFGDERIDLLKLDIEGGEYELLPMLDLPSLGVKVFSVQLHHTSSVRHARALIRRLDTSGYVAVGCCPAVKVTFVHRDVFAAQRSQPRKDPATRRSEIPARGRPRTPRVTRRPRVRT